MILGSDYLSSLFVVILVAYVEASLLFEMLVARYKMTIETCSKVRVHISMLTQVMR